MSEKDLIADGKEAFEQAVDAEGDNRANFIDDLRFARLSEQWPDKIIKQRQLEGRPCLTINRLPSFIRQVVNDARQNKPAIKVHPADSQSDVETAKIYDGLIRNIEYASSADTAYDTATESAVSGGFGYFTIDIDFAHDDTFDLDILIKRVPDPLLIYGDPNSTEADSSDWNTAFETVFIPNDEFEEDYPDAEKVDFDSLAKEVGEPWFRENNVLVAKWWRREEVERTILLMSDGSVLDEERLADCKDYLDAQGITVLKSRVAKSYKVKRHLMTGAEILKSEDWVGKFIPIVPVYGDEIMIDGKRHFRSLIHDAKDPQRMFNYWRTTTTELVALAPKAPFIGKKGTFKIDAVKWATVNTQSHSTLEYDNEMPQRQPFAGVPAGALQEALNSSDDMKSIMGIYDASLGARSNETSGKAIMARQREGDVSTFHFIDNMSRAIRHAGRIIIDLIPHIYQNDRIVRVLGEDGTPSQAPLGQPVPVTDPQGQPVMNPQTGEPHTRIYDLGVGKYDLTVTAGPSYTTRRQEAADQMVELLRAFPQAAPVIGDLYAKSLDWPGADEIAARLKALYERTMGGGGQQQGIPPEQIAKVTQELQQLQARVAELTQENTVLKHNADIKQQEVQVKGFDAMTDRMRAVHDITKPPEVHVPPAA
jgi:hypothetical protein